jgi:RNA polymerase sigma-70 factor (ECF subfamily)
MRRVKRWRSREADLNEATAIGQDAVAVEPDLKSRLRAAIGKLPPKYRLVFLMFDVEGYSHEEISTALGMPTGTSKARLARARAKLRDELKEFAGEWVT